MMPKRRHTRTHNTAKAIAAERRLNQNYAASVCEQGNPDESWSTWPAPVRARARANDPPSF